MANILEKIIADKKDSLELIKKGKSLKKIKKRFRKKRKSKSIKSNKRKSKLSANLKEDSEKIYKEGSTKKLVKKFTEIANNVNIHGLICSGDDLRVLGKFNKLIKITPGVKMFARNDDQKRVTFAHNALQDGASFVVIGRELIGSKKPLELLKKYGEQNKNKNLWTK